MRYRRVAIYHVPSGAFHSAGSSWLGWDNRAGRALDQPMGSVGKTIKPQKYGFHATIKAPFRLNDGCHIDTLITATQSLCASLSAVDIGTLRLKRIGGFLAIVPQSSSEELLHMAQTLVTKLDTLRSPLTQDDIARRRKSRLSARQDALMLDWGYPYVLEQFKYHMTLTDLLSAQALVASETDAAQHFAKFLTTPYSIHSVSLCAEDHDGRFHVLKTFDLSGPRM